MLSGPTLFRVWAIVSIVPNMPEYQTSGRFFSAPKASSAARYCLPVGLSVRPSPDCACPKIQFGMSPPYASFSDSRAHEKSPTTFSSDTFSCRRPLSIATHVAGVPPTFTTMSAPWAPAATSAPTRFVESGS